jgi:hypothetical protein
VHELLASAERPTGAGQDEAHPAQVDSRVALPVGRAQRSGQDHASGRGGPRDHRPRWTGPGCSLPIELEHPLKGLEPKFIHRLQQGGRNASILN